MLYGMARVCVDWGPFGPHWYDVWVLLTNLRDGPVGPFIENQLCQR